VLYNNLSDSYSGGLKAKREHREKRGRPRRCNPALFEKRESFQQRVSHCLLIARDGKAAGKTGKSENLPEFASQKVSDGGL
jgi:hypothetical protein